jgi:nucleoside-diphosphate-sugar epimerase
VLRELAPGARFVLVSSLAAAGPGADGQSSLLPPAAARPVSAYGESKRQGELAVTDAPGLDFAIVRPPVIYGAGDGATRLLFRQAMAPVTFVPPRSTPLSVAHVDDVVRAILCAAGAAPRGAILPVDGPERTDTHAFVRAIAAAAGRRARLVPMPLAIAAGAANLVDIGCRLMGRNSYFNRDKVRELAAPGWVADGGPLRRLGCVPQVALAAGLREVALAERLVAATSAGA